jgi:uncharacterized protein (DUF433 family)
MMPPDSTTLTAAPVLPDWRVAPRPLIVLDPDGVYRVGGTRVRLETVVWAFRQGSTAEEILLKYPALELSDIYSTIGYYIGHRDAVDAYVEARRQQAEEARRELEVRFPSAGVRERLLARQGTRS